MLFVKHLANHSYIFLLNREESNIVYSFFLSLILGFISREMMGLGVNDLRGLLQLSYRQNLFIEFNRSGTAKKITEIYPKTVPRFISCLLNRLQFNTILLQ